MCGRIAFGVRLKECDHCGAPVSDWPSNNDLKVMELRK